MPLVKVKEKFQITLPAELREALHLAVGDMLEATIEQDKIVLASTLMECDLAAIIRSGQPLTDAHFQEWGNATYISAGQDVRRRSGEPL